MSGFANEVVPPEQLGECADRLGRLVAGNAPLTVQASKEAVRRMLHSEHPVDEDLIRMVYTSQDFRDAVAAFFEKRSPDWSGR